MPEQKLTVLVDDNFHYQDEDERYKLGEFDDLAAAISACQRVVDGYLTEAYEPGMSAADLHRSYTSFGEDPYIVGADQPVPFSAWDYAKQRCQEICKSRVKALS